jgi:hypothetical protein
MDLNTDDRTWAFEQFAGAEFGDVRRRSRATSMLRRALARPAGKLTEVFEDGAERQGAYDFVQGVVSPDAIVAAIAAAACAEIQDDVGYTVLDGTSLTLTDRTGTKGFGSIGRRALPTRGLKVISALALSRDGVPIGLLDMQWWAREAKSGESREVRRRGRNTETRHWVAAIHAIAARLDTHGCARRCVVVDREGDNTEILRALHEVRTRYIVRASVDRPLADRPTTLRRSLRRKPVIGTRVVAVPAAPNRRARTAVLDVRSARVVLDLPDRRTGGRTKFETNVVWAVERRAPQGTKKLDWMLLTNEPIDSFAAASAVLDGYCLRWRIEDFHKTWKSGRCNVEQTQLRARDHVVRWATMLATVAARLEQLKHLARTTPDAPASVLFSDLEILALKAAKNRQKKRTETVPDGMPTIGQAVRWLGDLGGYAGRSGLPGTITLSRGLARFEALAIGFALAYESTGKHRKK